MRVVNKLETGHLDKLDTTAVTDIRLESTLESNVKVTTIPVGHSMVVEDIKVIYYINLFYFHSAGVSIILVITAVRIILSYWHFITRYLSAVCIRAINGSLSGLRDAILSRD